MLLSEGYAVVCPLSRYQIPVQNHFGVIRKCKFQGVCCGIIVYLQVCCRWDKLKAEKAKRAVAPLKWRRLLGVWIWGQGTPAISNCVGRSDHQTQSEEGPITTELSGLACSEFFTGQATKRSDLFYRILLLDCRYALCVYFQLVFFVVTTVTVAKVL